MFIKSKNVKENFSASFELKNISETKDDAGNSFGFFEGYAAVFGNLDHADDIIEAGAFDKTLASGKKVKLLSQHDTRKIIGSIVEAKVDAYGLWVKGRINLETEQGKEVYSLLKSGDLDSMSIGFNTTEQEWKTDSNGETIRHIKEVDLWEVSVVTFPCNEKALVTDVKSALLDEAESLADIEAYLRFKNLSRKEATAVVSEIKKFLTTQRDAALEEEKNKQRDADEAPEKVLDTDSVLLEDLFKQS